MSDSKPSSYPCFPDLVQPAYPYPDVVNPNLPALREEAAAWIEEDSPFLDKTARQRHREHRFADLACRAFPSLSLAELRPVTRFTIFGAILDDYLDHRGERDLDQFRERTMAVMRGEVRAEPEPGLLRQFFLMRRDAIQCDIPEHLYGEYVAAIDTLLGGYRDEKRYLQASESPPMSVYPSLREETSGGKVYAKYLAVQSDYRGLPDAVLRHAAIPRSHTLAGRLIGWHNDFVSLGKEMSRRGDVANLVLVMRREHNVSIREAYSLAMAYHDVDLREFVELERNPPDFGEWSTLAAAYLFDLGVMLKGVHSWHVRDTPRYRPGYFVEPENSSGQRA